MIKVVSGLVKTPADAEVAIQRIMNMGYRREEISLIMSEDARRQHFAIESSPQVAAGAGVGGAVGGAMGAVIAAIAAVGTSLALPGLGLIVAGPVAAALAGAGAGGATGGLIGALVGIGVPELRARVYETGLTTGWLLLGVEAHSAEDARKLEALFDDFGAENIRTSEVDPRRLEGALTPPASPMYRE
jgi:hypothetical protein